ncbi:hypothetical protein [Streptomyces seoulensis]|uniref:hypothetical protein n=1 Tax=Streptomyces seoulensis TaxID=73044 RepID=UPI001FCA7C97|nr:hypothetical protein [Streptomyces seoulensis]BDH08411.1 hypothetical protein HEK131_56380 [Streptomyces seoulensis]
MSTVLTLDDLSAPLQSLRLLAVDFPDLPGPVVDVSSIFPDRLSLSLHDGQGGFASFEAWRAALGIAPAAVDFHMQCDGRTGVMQAQTFYGGAHIELTGYTQVAAGGAA